MITVTRYFIDQAARRSLREIPPKTRQFTDPKGANDPITSLALLFRMGCTYCAVLDTLIDNNSGCLIFVIADPNYKYPRTIRIVMNRGLSIEKYTAVIIEALQPRMNGEDTEKLEEFKKLNPSVDLIEGAEMEMIIHSWGYFTL